MTDSWPALDAAVIAEQLPVIMYRGESGGIGYLVRSDSATVDRVTALMSIHIPDRVAYLSGLCIRGMSSPTRAEPFPGGTFGATAFFGSEDEGFATRRLSGVHPSDYAYICRSLGDLDGQLPRYEQIRGLLYEAGQERARVARTVSRPNSAACVLGF